MSLGSVENTSWNWSIISFGSLCCGRERSSSHCTSLLHSLWQRERERQSFHMIKHFFSHLAVVVCSLLVLLNLWWRVKSHYSSLNIKWILLAISVNACGQEWIIQPCLVSAKITVGQARVTALPMLIIIHCQPHACSGADRGAERALLFSSSWLSEKLADD